MRKFLLLLTALASAGTMSGAEGPYVQLFGGANWGNISHGSKFQPAEVDFQTGYVVGCSLGYRIWYNFRLEGEYAYRHNKIKIAQTETDNDIVTRLKSTGKVDCSTGMANLLWDIPIGEYGFNPYIGGGIGYAWNAFRSSDHVDVVSNGATSKVRIPKGKHNNNGFAWQIIGGISVPLTLCIDLGIEYRYCKLTEHMRNQSVVVASKYLF